MARRRARLSADQLPLFDGAPKAKPARKRRPKDWIDKEFAKFHTKHPEVLEQLINHLARLHAEGRARYGVGAVFENFRWHRRIPKEDDPEETYKLNNNYRSRYARLIVALRPELDGVIELRALRSERRKR